jgi:hypothetical protein
LLDLLKYALSGSRKRKATANGAIANAQKNTPRQP